MTPGRLVLILACCSSFCWRESRALQPPRNLLRRPRCLSPRPLVYSRTPIRAALADGNNAAVESSTTAAPGIWTVPNILTLSRVAAIPILGITWNSRRARTALFVAAAFTDWLDGFLARRMNLSSRFGAFLDPVADKLMVATALVLLSAEWGMVVAGPATCILCREVGVTALREWMAESGERDTVAVSFAGKVKTTAQLVAICVLLSSAPPVGTPSPVAVAGLCALYVATTCTLVSGLGYLKAAWPVLTRNG